MWKTAFFSGLIILAFFAGIFFFKPDRCQEGCEKKMASVTANEFVGLFRQGGKTVLDVRTPAEYSQGHLTGSLNADFNNESGFRSFLEGLDRDKQYLIYCRSGNRSGKALKLMDEMGFTNVVNLEDGIVSLQDSGLVMEK